MLNRLASVIISLLALSCCIAGCGGGGGGTARTGPTISNLAALPTNWSSGGGTATIQANVTDSDGVASVTASVETISGSKTVNLVQAGGTTLFTGAYTVPANTAIGGSATVYSIVITATDSTGASTKAQTFTFSVPAPTEPPQPPISGS